MSKKQTNKGYEKVADTRNDGKFASPNDIPLAESRGLRLPVDLHEWVESEAQKRGCSRNDLIREAVRFFKAHLEAPHPDSES